MPNVLARFAERLVAHIAVSNIPARLAERLVAHIAVSKFLARLAERLFAGRAVSNVRARIAKRLVAGITRTHKPTIITNQGRTVAALADPTAIIANGFIALFAHTQAFKVFQLWFRH